MTKRVFFALNLPLTLKQNLGKIVEELRSLNRGRTISWVALENLHLTLHFLGNQKEEDISRLIEIARPLADQTVSFRLLTNQFDFFPNPFDPRVIFLAIEDDGSARALAKDLGRVLMENGFQIDQRPWRSHLTLGRIKDQKGACRLGSQKFPPTVFEISSFELMESELGPNGSRYRVLASFKFRPAET